MTPSRRRQVGADLQLALVALVWGGTFLTVKDAVASYPVFSFLALRFGLAAVVLLAVGWRRVRSLGWRGLAAAGLMGLLLFGGYAFQTLGLRHTTASRAGLITGLSVALVPVLSTLLLRQPPTIPSGLGLCLATVGLALLTLGQGLAMGGGDLIVLGCAVCFALHIVSVSAFAPGRDPLALTAVQVACVALISAGAAPLAQSGWPAPGPAIWLAAGFTGLLATAAAFLIQTAAQRFTTPTHTALIFAGEPVFAALFGVLLAGEAMTSRSAAGGILIVMGAVASEIPWSERTAAAVSRFLGPHYVAALVLIVLGLRDPASAWGGLLWAAGLCLLSIVVPVAIFRSFLRKGTISDWYISDRRERLRFGPVGASVAAVAAPLALLLVCDGPRLLAAAFSSAFILVVFNLLVTLAWKISHHVAGVAASATLVTAAVGIGAAPVLLLIPLVAWARVKVGAHTPMQAVAGGLAGVAVALAVLHTYGMI